MSSYPEIDKTLSEIRRRNMARHRRLSEVERFRERFRDVMQESVRPVFKDIAKLLKEAEFDVKIGTLDAAPPVADDDCFQSITLYMWPPGQRDRAPDEGALQVRLTGNPVTKMVEISRIAAPADWRGFRTLELQEVELASLSSALVGEMVSQVVATFLTLPD